MTTISLSMTVVSPRNCNNGDTPNQGVRHTDEEIPLHPGFSGCGKKILNLFVMLGVEFEGTAMAQPWLLGSCQPRAPGQLLSMLLKLRAAQFPPQNYIQVCGFRPHFRHT